MRVVLGVVACFLALAVASPVMGQNARNLQLTVAEGPLADQPIYTNSYALLIGINKYPNLPGYDLNWAVSDVTAVRDILVSHYGFPAENVTLLTDAQATKANIENVFAEYGNANKIGPNDRILIYFSGHGQTIKMPQGGELGFLIPHDAKVDLTDFNNATPYLKTCLRMDMLWQWADSTPAKHLLLVADACYSGLFASARGTESIDESIVKKLVSVPARQIITAGRKGEQAFEDDKTGMGIFTSSFVAYLREQAMEPRKYFMAQDVHGEMVRRVAGKQNPQFVNYNTEGQFVFITAAEPLSTLPVQEVAAVPAGSPAAKLKTLVMEVTTTESAQDLAEYEQELTDFITYSLAETIDQKRVTILQQEDVHTMKQMQRALGKDPDALDIGDVSVQMTITKCAITEQNITGGDKKEKKSAFDIGKGIGLKKPKVLNDMKGIKTGVKQAEVEMKVVIYDGRTGQMSDFTVTGKDTEATAALDVDLTKLLEEFAISYDFFEANPIGKALGKALEEAIPKTAKSLSDASK